jgi:hypothetical protein
MNESKVSQVSQVSQVSAPKLGIAQLEVGDKVFGFSVGFSGFCFAYPYTVSKVTKTQVVITNPSGIVDRLYRCNGKAIDKYDHRYFLPESNPEASELLEKIKQQDKERFLRDQIEELLKERCQIGALRCRLAGILNDSIFS